jgi:glycosyltransferase involved in cell wall biosynthesis
MNYLWRHSPPRTDSRQVLWVTNLAAPYRLPVWQALSQRNRLHVMLLESNAQMAADSAANRGKDWQYEGQEGFTLHAAATWKFSRGEARHYTLRSMTSLLKLRKFDVVVFGGWESPAYWQILVIAILFRVRRVGFYESILGTRRHNNGPISWMRCVFFRLMHSTVVPGAAAGMSLLDMGVRATRIVEGFNAVDVEKFHRAASCDLQRADGPTGQGHRFLYAGQLVTRKRVGHLIDAFERIACPDDQLSVVGVGELAESLRRKAEEQHANIEFLGYVDGSAMPSLMADSHTLVLPSSLEVWGLVVNEALASGMHVVVSENCGIVSSIRTMKGVFVVREDLHDLADQMRNSRQAWSGRILQPEILVHTPETFAGNFDEAIKGLGRSSNNPA